MCIRDSCYRLVLVLSSGLAVVIALIACGWCRLLSQNKQYTIVVNTSVTHSLKFGMISVTYIPKPIPVALPKLQRRCMVMVGYIERQTVTANTHIFY